MQKEKETLRGRIFRQGLIRTNGAPDTTAEIPPCQAACPLGQDIRGYLHLISKKRYDEAFALIRQTNPLPSVCGTVCHHPCERACIRGAVDEPLSIKALKRFAADHAFDRVQVDPPAVKQNRRISVIGSGPAGLTAAHDLALAGFKVEVFESLDRPGGMLSWAIPDFRLPRDVLQRDIRMIESLGVRIRTGVFFGKDISVDSLREDGADAVLIATGTMKGLRLNLGNEEYPDGCLDCLEFLRDLYEGGSRKPTGKVLVIGGGNAAVDSARSAIREGALEVTVLYRRGPEEMPADPHEIKEAVSEGILIEYLTAPVRFLKQDGALTGLECVRTELRPAPDGKRPRPFPVEGTAFELKADTIITAVGQTPDRETILNGLEPAGRDKPELTLDPESMRLNHHGVFAAGDFLNGASTVVEAMASGRRAALAIRDYLEKKGAGTDEQS
jgi:NADH-quinone oxidoreductase subunit F